MNRVIFQGIEIEENPELNLQHVTYFGQPKNAWQSKVFHLLFAL